MNQEIESGDMTIRPWPDRDGELEVELYTDNKFDTYATGWLNRSDVLTLVKGLIKNFKITEDELDDSAK